jgi:hypothetical protein
VIAALVAAATAAGFGGDVSGDPAAWSSVEEWLGRSAGSYTETYTVVDQGRRIVAVRQWVAFDMDRKVIDQRGAFGVDPVSGMPVPVTSREHPSMRFIRRPEGILMWFPGLPPACKGPWVDLDAATLKQATSKFGLTIGDGWTSEPALILDNRRGQPRVVESSKNATVYEVLVPGTSGIPPSSGLLLRPGGLAAYRRLQSESFPARVRVSGDGARIQISLDLSRQWAELGQSAHAFVTWSLDHTPVKPDMTRPAKVAPASCLK